jgi:hypothetical protein
MVYKGAQGADALLSPDLPMSTDRPAGTKTGFLLMIDRFTGGAAASVSKIGMVAALGLVVTGCMGPTYGTDTPASQQLFEDITGVVSFGPEKRDPIAYTPRPELVRPASLEVLPPPQEAAQNNAAWPESPEQRLARVREEATANQDNNLYRSPVNQRGGQQWTAADPGVAPFESSAEQRAEINRRITEGQQGSATQRRFLSEPPVTYRQPAETAPAGDVGEDEWRKERRLQAASGEKTGWRSLIPWL